MAGMKPKVAKILCIAAVISILVFSVGLEGIRTTSEFKNSSTFDLQQRFSNSTVTETVSNERTWAEIQDDLRSVYHDQPDLLSQTRFIPQQFDPAARVRLLPGLDGQPGTADFDDNANGVIDDAGELGATFSDDLCVVEASQTPANLIQPSIVLQRGAYVATQERITQSTHYRDRIVVLYEGRDNSWSFVLDQ